ncbi:hypothetical protein D9757_006202 [Collybiopsis confluens]|uniref:HIT domain-containing protein n=1 Tax=Collybiopsis confluens TaxID=2823264 RepID=A0A8H5HK13_9AGAR|nr:hypothetical protein D9757_006202 [Collybiopsis confluens]
MMSCTERGIVNVTKKAILGSSSYAHGDVRTESWLPLCTIVASALHDSWGTPASSTPSSSTELLWRDDNFCAYRERKYPVSSKGHVIVAFNLHVPSIYTLSSTDLPLLYNVKNLAIRLLTALNTSPISPITATFPSSSTLLDRHPGFRIGFITPPFKDSKIPVTDHLHCHAYIEPSDLLGWFRGLAYGSLAWYDIDDLIAEIRESVSNNRIKSGYENRQNAPIDKVPQAGARSGTANGIETTTPGITGQSERDDDLENGESSPTSAQSLFPS